MFNDDLLIKGSTILKRYMTESLTSSSESDHILEDEYSKIYTKVGMKESAHMGRFNKVN